MSVELNHVEMELINLINELHGTTAVLLKENKHIPIVEQHLGEVVDQRPEVVGINYLQRETWWCIPKFIKVREASKYY